MAQKSSAPTTSCGSCGKRLAVIVMPTIKEPEDRKLAAALGDTTPLRTRLASELGHVIAAHFQRGRKRRG
jgi:hypothetical protein